MTKSVFKTAVFFVFALPFLAIGQPKLVKTKITDNITASVPKGWRPMDGLDFTERYPSVRAPIAAYTNEERIADFSVNISATQWPDENLDIAKQFFKASLMNMFDRVEMISEGVREVNGKKFIYFEFESRVNGNKKQESLRDPVLKYTYIQYYLEPRRALVFTFNCPRHEREQWQSSAQAIMKSIKIK